MKKLTSTYRREGHCHVQYSPLPFLWTLFQAVAMIIKCCCSAKANGPRCLLRVILGTVVVELASDSTFLNVRTALLHLQMSP